LRDTGWGKESEKGYTEGERRRENVEYVGERRKHGHMCEKIVEGEGAEGEWEERIEEVLGKGRKRVG